MGRLLIVSLLALAGCDREAVQFERAAGETQSAAVATVNGEPIALGEVERFVAASGLSPRAALAQLTAERLLAQYAAARGYGELREVEAELERALVHALLAREVERDLPAGDVEARRERLSAWLLELQRAAQPRYDDAVIARALAKQTP